MPEAMTHAPIDSNTLEDNGQSEVDAGGNNSVSSNNVIHQQHIRHNRNNGINHGVTGKVVSGANYVGMLSIVGNASKGNLGSTCGPTRWIARWSLLSSRRIPPTIRVGGRMTSHERGPCNLPGLGGQYGRGDHRDHAHEQRHLRKQYLHPIELIVAHAYSDVGLGRGNVVGHNR